jgi:hypothetical protein
MFENVDNWLLGRCTAFAHWFQRLTGYTSFFIAKLGMSLVVWSVLVDIVNYWHRVLAQETSLMWTVFLGFVILSYFARIIACSEAERRLYEGRVVLPTWVLEERTHKGRGWRLIGVTLTLAMTVIFWGNIHFFPHPFLELVHWGYAPGITIYVYFLHVDPLPPGTSKVRQFIESFGFGPKPVRVEN